MQYEGRRVCFRVLEVLIAAGDLRRMSPCPGCVVVGIMVLVIRPDSPPPAFPSRTELASTGGLGSVHRFSRDFTHAFCIQRE